MTNGETKTILRELQGEKGQIHQFVKIDGDDKVVCINADEEFSPFTLKFKGLVQLLRSIFLPQGYPFSVSNDYLEYQLWDTVQAFASSLSGSLSTKAVLEGVGVGNSASTPLAATLMWLIKDGTGMVGRIIFAWSKGTELDADCKQWRLFADLLNDCALTLELCAPYVVGAIGASSREVTALLCVSGVAKSIVGVAGGATRAALTHHQARQGNLADVSAKDGSQETLVNLAALLASLWLLPLLNDSERLTWMAFLLFTALHIFANYKAVKVVRFETLNRSRFLILLKYYATTGIVQSVQETNNLEPVFSNFTSNKEEGVCGYRIFLGRSIKSVNHSGIEDHLADYSEKNYALIPDVSNKAIYAIYRKECLPEEMLESYYHAVLSAMLASNQVTHANTKGNIEVEDALKYIHLEKGNYSWTHFKKALIAKGWNIQSCLLSPSEWTASW